VQTNISIDNSIETLRAELILILLKRNAKLISAESCTGGWLAKYCTDVAGSSAWFEGGVVTYSNMLKQKLLNVQNKTLLQHGAVSETVASEMTLGACALAKTDESVLSVSITGIAGPGGGTKDKPVGTVCFAWGQKTEGLSSQLLKVDTQIFAGGRDEIRLQSVHHALINLVKILKEK